MNLKTVSNTTHPFDISHGLSLLCILALGLVLSLDKISPSITPVAIPFLGLSIMMAVHHAETIALRVGPSIGAIILALSVTVIEVGLIVSLMGNDSVESLYVARDTVFSAVIIVTNGIMGYCLFVGGLRFKEIGFHPGGANSLLAVLVVLSGLAFVMPNFTISTEPGTYSYPQLIFVSVACLLLYFSLIFSQTITHRDYFAPVNEQKQMDLERSDYIPSKTRTWISFLGLVFSLTAVVGLAKALSPSIEAGVTAMGVPRAIVGIVIALLVLAPETWAAVAAARANQLQTSLNLALGSGAASIALTVPAVSLYAILNEKTLVLGLDGKGTVFLLISFLTCALTFAGGRTTALMGLVHLTLMFSYIALNLIP